MTPIQPRRPPSVDRVLAAARPGPGFGRSHSRAAAPLVDGSFQPLPLALRRDPAEQAATRLLAGGESSLRALLVALGATGVPEATWRAEDPAADVLRGVETPEDLAGPASGA